MWSIKNTMMRKTKIRWEIHTAQRRLEDCKRKWEPPMRVQNQRVIDTQVLVVNLEKEQQSALKMVMWSTKNTIASVYLISPKIHLIKLQMKKMRSIKPKSLQHKRQSLRGKWWWWNRKNFVKKMKKERWSKKNFVKKM